MDDAIASLTQALREDPDNHQGWFQLGLAYRDGERFAEAERAPSAGDGAGAAQSRLHRLSGRGLLLKGGDTPPPEAERLLRRVLELQPGNLQARYYLATMKDLRGDHRAAVDELIALLREAPADAVWQPQVRDAVTAIAQRNDIDISGRLPPAPAPSAPTATAAIPGPTREQMEAARGIPPSQQDAMVRGMVDRLANRLRQNPRDADGWIRLMRAHGAQRPRRRRRGAAPALAAFQDDSATQRRLRTAAGELGVPGA